MASSDVPKPLLVKQWGRVLKARKPKRAPEDLMLHFDEHTLPKEYRTNAEFAFEDLDAGAGRQRLARGDDPEGRRDHRTTHDRTGRARLARLALLRATAGADEREDDAGRRKRTSAHCGPPGRRDSTSASSGEGRGPPA